MSDDWMKRLREADGALRPTGSARGEILERVRRSRRRRAVGVTVGAVTSVTLLAVGFAVLPGLAGPWADEDPAVPSPATSGPTDSTTAPDPELFDCPADHRVFRDDPPPIEDLEEQQAIVDELGATAFKAFEVHRAEPTPLGVAVLVITDDVPAARQFLTQESGVALVGGWNPDAPAPGFGIDLHTSIDQMVRWELDPVVHWVRTNMRGPAGYGGIAVWPEAGAVVLEWKAPIPEQIAALAGARPNRVQVVIDPTPYSAQDFRQASDRVIDAIRSGQVDVEWSSASACGDNTGLEVGITPETLGDRRAQLQEQLSEIAGMPVRVRPEQRPIALTG